MRGLLQHLEFVGSLVPDMQPLVSIVVPAYNAASFLPRALDSLVAQTYRPLEVIVVDDGSTDETARIADDFAREHASGSDFTVRVIRQPNGGRGAARAAGVAAAQGEFVGFVDADDHVLPVFYECLVGLTKSSSDVDVVVARYQNIAADGTLGHVYDEGDSALYGHSLAERPELMDQVEASLCNKLFRRSLFTAGTAFPQGKDFEDLATTYRLMACARRLVKVDSEPLYFYQQGGPVSVMAACDDRFNDLVDAISVTIGFFRTRGLFERFEPQLTRLALRHLIFARFGDFFVRNGPAVTWPYLDLVYESLDSQLPGWRESPAFHAMCGSIYSRQLVRHKLLLKAYVALRARV